jgi:cob(I)alamin adenosyltransferase
MSINSGSGDDGTTSLSGGQRVPKHHVRVEAYGSVDELIAWIGLIRDFKENKNRAGTLIYIQDQLMACISLLAAAPDDSISKRVHPDNSSVSILEKEIAEMESKLTPLHSFVLPGGNTLISYCHIARCVCRRAERAVCRLGSVEYSPEIVQKFLNRLSDYLFLLARILSLELDIQENIWDVR